MYPDRDKLSNVTRSGYIAARDQSMVKSDMTKDGKNAASFLFREWTQQHKHEASAKKQRFSKLSQKRNSS